MNDAERLVAVSVVDGLVDCASRLLNIVERMAVHVPPVERDIYFIELVEVSRMVIDLRRNFVLKSKAPPT